LRRRRYVRGAGQVSARRLLLAIYGASIPLAFVEPWLSWLCFATVVAMLFVPVVSAQRVRESMTDDHRNLERSCP